MRLELQRIIMPLAMVGVSSGFALTDAVAAPKAYVKVCNQTAPANPVSGNFIFTVDEVIPTNPGTATRTVTVAVGSCSGPIGVAAAAQIRVKEQPRPNTLVSAITVTGAGSSISNNLPGGTAVVMAPPFTTVVTFVNKSKLAEKIGIPTTPKN